MTQQFATDNQETALDETGAGHVPVVVMIDIVPDDLGRACNAMDFADAAGARFADYLEVKLHNDLKERGIQAEVNIKYLAHSKGQPRDDVMAPTFIKGTTEAIVHDTRNRAWQMFCQCQTESDWDGLYQTEINRALSSEKQARLHQGIERKRR